MVDHRSKLPALVLLATVLAGCQSVPWARTDPVTKQRTTTNAPASLVKADFKRQVVSACIDNLDEINESAGVSLLVGRAPGGYEWYVPNPNVQPYGPQDCRNLVITGVDIANNAVREVRGLLGDVIGGLPWVAVYQLGKYGFKAAGDRYEASGDIERYSDSPRDIENSRVNQRSTVDHSQRQEGEGNTQTGSSGPLDNGTSETVIEAPSEDPEEPEEPEEPADEEPIIELDPEA